MRRLALTLAIAVLAGCASLQSDRLVTGRAELPRRAELASVPFVAQQHLYCGPAALTMVLAWSGLDVTQDEIAAEVYTPGREGTLRSDVLAAARRHGRLAVPIETLDAVLGEIAAGHPVVIFQNLGLSWVPQWHFAVAIGYDLNAGEIVLHSGLDPRKVMALKTFERTWKRGDHWALAVLPPDELPARGRQVDVLQAAMGLERVGRLPDAVAAYTAITARWPDSLVGQMGLGNTTYALGDLTRAEAAYRAAIEHHARAPQPWNNLAYVLAARGDIDAAVEAAGEAIVRADGDAAPYSATLQEILEQGAKADVGPYVGAHPGA